jgi:hypothetical protein
MKDNLLVHVKSLKTSQEIWIKLKIIFKQLML